MPHAIIYKRCGALAQLVARHNGIVEAKGSTPLCSIANPDSDMGFGFFALCGTMFRHTEKERV